MVKFDKWFFIVSSILLVFAIFNLTSRTEFLSDADDNAHYMILAKSLAIGAGYKDISEPGWPEHYKYPPLFPMMLVPAIVLFGYNVMALKAYMVIFNVLSLLAIYLFFKELTKNKFVAVAVMTITGFSFEYFLWANDIMSETPFVMFSFFALYFLVKEKGYLSILFTIAAILTKSIGIVLVPAIFLHLLFKKQIRESAIYVGLTGLVFGLWSWRNWNYSESYINLVKYVSPYDKSQGLLTLSSISQRIGHNIYIHLNSMATLIFQYVGINPMLMPLFVIVLVFVTFLGAITAIQRKEYILPLYFTFFLGFLAFWPWDTIRFIVPIMPVVIYFFIRGLYFIAKLVVDTYSFDQKYINYAFVGMVIVLLISTLPGFFSKYTELREFKYDDGMVKYKYIAEWAKNNTKEDKIFLVRKPHLFYLWANRTAKTYPFSLDGAAWFNDVIYSDYLLRDELGTTTDYYVDNILAKLPELFLVEHSVPMSKTVLFKMIATEGNYTVEP